jgi:hypothetical protein
MKLDRGGLIGGGIYVAIAVPLMLFAEFGTNPKGTYIINQLATFPAGWLLSVLGIIDWLLDAFPWLNHLSVFFLFSFALCYLIGWGIRSLYRYDQKQYKRSDV